MFQLPDVQLPSGAQIERALALLHNRLGSKVLLAGDDVSLYRSDDSRIVGRAPAAVVLAESARDVQEALRIAHETGVPITPRAGGSGRTGGAVPVGGGIVVATHLMKAIVDIDRYEGTAVVQPGVVLDDLHAAVEAEGWFYPPDPNSSGVCCLAGNVAENAAGPRAFKYGVTRDYVLGIDTMLPAGQSFFAGRRTRKGVCGYDVVGTLVGSEGTLAAFGNITLRLIPRPDQVMTLVALFSRMEDASQAVADIVSQRLTPRCLEFLDGKTLEVMRASGNSIHRDAGALLLIEVDGFEAECERQAQLIGDRCSAVGALEVSVATSTDARRRLWDSRKQMSYAVRSRARHKLSEDVVVPRQKLAALLREVTSIGERNDIDALSYGHAGDGNLHVNFLWNTDDEWPRVEQAVHDLFRATIALGGTLSGEHGIGLLKAPFVPLEQSEELIELQRSLKNVFDPRGVLNPGKMFPTRGHSSC